MWVRRRAWRLVGTEGWAGGSRGGPKDILHLQVDAQAGYSARMLGAVQTGTGTGVLGWGGCGGYWGAAAEGLGLGKDWLVGLARQGTFPLAQDSQFLRTSPGKRR